MHLKKILKKSNNNYAAETIQKSKNDYKIKMQTKRLNLLKGRNQEHTMYRKNALKKLGA